MATGTQLPDMIQGLKAAPVGSAGDFGRAGAGEHAAFGAQLAELEQAMRDAGLDPTAISPEMLALLQQWLAGGMSLPPPAEGEGVGGRPLPPGDVMQALGGMLEKQSVMAGRAEAADVETRLDPPVGAMAGETPLKVALREVLALSSENESMPGISGAAEGRLSMALAVSPPTLSSTPAEALPSRNLLAMSLPQPVGDPRWGAALGERLLWMAKGDQQQAELKITPPNLGPLEVKLTLNDDRASVTFVSHHAQVRDAIEAALPRLREMLAQEALQLVQAEVSDGQAQRQGMASRQGGGPVQGDGEEAAMDSGRAEVAGVRSGSGLLDLFA